MHRSNPVYMVNKLTKVEEACISKMNVPISISELVVVYEKGHAEGESKLVKEGSMERDRVSRLVKHITLLAHIAEQYHKACYGKNEKVHQDSLNKITRLSLNEFALYTYKTPLSEKEFDQLLGEIERIAMHLSTNVHLVLGTLALGDHKKVKNMSLYVQGGDLPKIHVTTKSYCSSIDIRYSNYGLFGKSEKEAAFREYTKAEEAIDAVCSNQASAVSCDPVFVIETEGGAKAVIGVDICYDHIKSHAKKAFEYHLSMAAERGDVDYIPLQRSHIVISNPVTIDEEKSFSHMVLHADAVNGGLRSRWQRKAKTMDMVKMGEEKFLGATKMDYLSKGISVSNPPFGYDYVIEAYEEYSLTLDKDRDPELENRFFRLISQTNKSIMDKRIKNILQETGYFTDDNSLAFKRYGVGS